IAVPPSVLVPPNTAADARSTPVTHLDDSTFLAKANKAAASGKASESTTESTPYDRLRKQSPSPAIRRAVNAAPDPKTDPVYGFKVDKYEADHIVALKEIVKMPKFDQLTPQQQKEVVNLRENFLGLSKPSNASKGARSWSEWKGHSELGPVPEKVRTE